MKTAACLLVLYTLSAAAFADEADGFVGEPGCRVARPILEANESVLWKGPCKDGFADGAGVLQRNQKGLILATLVGSYEVTMARGRISGDGKLKYKNGDAYTGSFKDGRRDGKGYTAFANGDQYDGDYKNDVPHGAGEAPNATARYTRATGKTARSTAAAASNTPSAAATSVAGRTASSTARAC